jgi:hypothetical protein
MKSNYLFAVLLTVAFTSCDKKDKTDEETKTETLTSSSWKYDTAGADSDRNGTIDVSFDSSIDPCLKDNTITFSANGTGIVTEGTNVCPGAAASTAITWSFASNETMMNISGGGLFSGQFKLLNLSSTTLSLAKDTTVAPFGTLQLIVNFKH